MVTQKASKGDMNVPMNVNIYNPYKFWMLHIGKVFQVLWTELE